ncbi:MAG: UMP kinase [Candidatus Methanomethylicota archaeon]|uniref:Uridylate kinase n=1 Tax=Thermoproteota archaeon TaxID=2056631 RepID=A0A497F301_9CREN|nr:MAG: UMP kinase [Candidatus Verstraetearchaeota archaeon]RLE53602.1 MAG: UMP kinase [Candidatus Verstraetearchaeota archaeon]
MRSLVIKLSGHLLFTDLNAEKLRKYAEVVKELLNGGYRVAVVVGGGGKAREYIKVAKELGASNFERDVIGIRVTQINAALFALALGEFTQVSIPKTLEEMWECVRQGISKVIVTGGLIPGQSTVAVAALLAEAMRAELMINATNVEGVYTADPRKDPNAKLLKKITVKELIEVLRKARAEAGTYELFDLTSLKIIERSGIRVRVVDGRNEQNILRAALGEDVGTLIVPSK